MGVRLFFGSLPLYDTSICMAANYSHFMCFMNEVANSLRRRTGRAKETRERNAFYFEALVGRYAK